MYYHQYGKINNADLLPPYREDRDVRLIPADPDGILFSPDWVETMSLVEVHPETATPEGTIEALENILDHYAAMGVNVIWLTPVYQKGPKGNGYTNWGLHTLEPALTGTEDVEEGWRRIRALIEKAHKKNIRILLDLITWGCEFSAPLIEEHPEWFSGEAWGGAAFNWNNEEFRSWFIEQAIENILRSGADGYRCDCEPKYAGFCVFAEIRNRLLALGKKVAIIAEESSERRGSFDCEQDGVTGWIEWSRGQQYQHPRAYYLEGTNIVDAVQSGILHGDKLAQQNGTSGRNRYYTYCVSNHDFKYSRVNMNRLIIGYQAIFAPYIPLWYLGAELGMHAEGRVIYFIPTDWSLLDREENLTFCTDVARYMRIRLQNPDIFCTWAMDHRNANIAKIDAGTSLQSYARFAGGRAILVVPHSDEETDTFTVCAELEAIGVSAEGLRVTDLLGGGEAVPAEIADGKCTFRAQIQREHIGVYLLECGA